MVVADSGSEIDGSGSSHGPAAEVAQEIEANGGTAVACCASVADEDGAASIVATAIEHFGRLDVVVNNAGISDKHPFPELSHEQFRRMMDVHFFGTLYVTEGRVAIPARSRLRAHREHDVRRSPRSPGRADELRLRQGRGLGPDPQPGGRGSRPRDPGQRGRAPSAHAHVGRRPAGRAGTAPERRAESVLDRMDPELVAPAAAYLAHESCTLNGEVLVAGGGDVMRLAPIVTRGIARGNELSIEDVAESIDAILDGTDARVAPVGSW